MSRRVQSFVAALAVILSVQTLKAQTDNATIRTAVKDHFEQYQCEVDLKTLKKLVDEELAKNGKKGKKKPRKRR